MNDPWFKPVHIFLVQHRQSILSVFHVVEGLLYASLFIGYYLFVNVPSSWELLGEVGHELGTVAAYTYALTLVAGILKRLNILPLIRVSLTTYRRHIGIISFMCMVLHAFVLSFYGDLERGALPLLTLREFYGFVAIWLLLPLWLTSNDWSVKALAGLWHWVHRLSYVAAFFIYMHVMLVTDGLLKAVLITTYSLVVLSWIVFWTRKRKSVVLAQGVQDESIKTTV